LFGKEGWEAYKGKERVGIALAGHEVRHTLQYEERGLLVFLAQYVGQSLKAGFDPHKMPLEQPAYADEDVIAALLLANRDLLISIQNGTYTGASGSGSVSVSVSPDFSGWTNSLVPYLDPYLYDAFLAGQVCIDGVCGGG
jgi:hypothetical protein